ncbi:VOC family protein [Bosea sp. TWI1241]|uniref:VOC family protein n=1 Tax=Bosea sp. TWI1241 TaxID=3148904 RepID=UPI003207BB0D
MALKHILGVDHVVVAARDLARAARDWEALGFTVSPRGLHSPILGTANHTIMLGEDYVELLSPVAETEQNQPTRDFLAAGEGIERIAFTTDDAEAGAAEISARGFPAIGPIHFGRPVPLPGGGEAEARFSVFRWPLSERPGATRIFACQHRTREVVWLPELQAHANGAVALRRIEILSADPAAAAAHLARLTDQAAVQEGDAWRVASGPNRADFVFYDAQGLAARYPAAAREGARAEGVVALAIASRDLDAAAAASGAIHHGEAATVPAGRAAGVIVSFVAA